MSSTRRLAEFVTRDATVAPPTASITLSAQAPSLALEAAPPSVGVTVTRRPPAPAIAVAPPSASVTLTALAPVVAVDEALYG
jgi:hypothetical protein